MTCTCLKDLQEKLNKNGYDNFVFDNTAYALFSQTKERENPEIATMLNITSTYKAKKQNGEYKKNREKLNIQATYCPFCGKITKEKP